MDGALVFFDKSMRQGGADAVMTELAPSRHFSPRLVKTTTKGDQARGCWQARDPLFTAVEREGHVGACVRFSNVHFPTVRNCQIISFCVLGGNPGPIANPSTSYEYDYSKAFAENT